MRVSIDENDIGYCANYQRINITLDGKMVKHAITADEELGEVTCYLLDEHGRIKFDKSTQLCETVVLRGKVEIELPPKWERVT